MRGSNSVITASGFWASSSVVGWLAFIGLLITAAAVIGASFRNSHQAQVIANYREAANSWKEKAEAQDVAIKELEARDAEKERQIAELTGQLTMLRDLVTSRPDFERLTVDFERMVQRMDDRVGEALALRSEIHSVAEAVKGIAVKIGDGHG